MRERLEHHWFGPVIANDPKLARAILARIRREGALPARAFEGDSGHGGMWNWKPAKRMLDALWTAGKLAIAGRNGFERLYDLPARVLPAATLRAPMPSEAATLRGLALRAIKARGALTERGVVEHYRLDGGAARIRPALARLVREGLVERRGVADGGADVYLAPGEDRAPPAGVLLSPFDNLLWDRAFTRRIFQFDHLIEVYKKPHERRFGYYVMPFLLGDRVVGRADMKSDRETGVLHVRSLHLEPGVRRSGAFEDAFAGAHERLARTLGLKT
jgi:uncharacterized protein YcaQ